MHISHEYPEKILHPNLLLEQLRADFGGSASMTPITWERRNGFLVCQAFFYTCEKDIGCYHIIADGFGTIEIEMRLRYPEKKLVRYRFHKNDDPPVGEKEIALLYRRDDTGRLERKDCWKMRVFSSKK